MSDQHDANLENDEALSVDGSSMGTSTADFFINDDVVDEDPLEDPEMEPEDSELSRDLDSAPNGVSIFNNLDTEDVQVGEGGLGVSTVSNYRRDAL